MRSTSRSLVTLAEIVRLALPPGTEVLTGAKSMERSITWARSFGARPVSLATIESGELVLVQSASAPFSNDPRLLARLIRDLSEAGVSAFVVNEGCPPEAVEAAESLSVPLLQLPPGASVTDTERSIVSLIVDRDGLIRRRLEQIYEQMISCLMDDQGSATVASVVAQATGKQVVVLNEYVHVQVSVPNPDPPEGLVQACADQVQMAPKPTSRRPTPIALQSPGSKGQSMLMLPLVLKGTAAGYLTLIGPSESFSEFDADVAQRAMSVLAMEVAKQRAITEVQLRVQGDLVEDLLAGTFPSEDAAIFRARSLGYDLTQPHVACCFGLDVGEGATPRMRSSRWLEPARRELRRLEPAALVRDTQNQLSAFLPLRRNEDPNDTVERIESIRVALSNTTEEYTLSAGIGCVSTNPAGFARAHREAEQSLIAAQLIFGGEQAVHFNRLGADRLLLELRSSAALREFVNDIVGELENYDRQHRSELVSTVSTFLACNGNHVRTAQELHLHRNSLLYRLDRAQKVLDRDLDDSDTRLALQLALRGQLLLRQMEREVTMMAVLRSPELAESSVQPRSQRSSRNGDNQSRHTAGR